MITTDYSPELALAVGVGGHTTPLLSLNVPPPRPHHAHRPGSQITLLQSRSTKMKEGGEGQGVVNDSGCKEYKDTVLTGCPPQG